MGNERVATPEEIEQISHMYPQRIAKASVEELDLIQKLSPEQIKEVIAFDLELTRGKNPDPEKPEDNYHQVGTNRIKTIEAIFLDENLSFATLKFYTDYLDDSEVQDKMQKIYAALYPEGPTNSSFDISKIQAAFELNEQNQRANLKNDRANENKDKTKQYNAILKDFKDLATATEYLYKAAVARAIKPALIINPESTEYEGLASIDKSKLNKADLEKLLKPAVTKVRRNEDAIKKKYNEYKKLKQFYKQTYNAIDTEDSADEVKAAKKVIINLHVERLNYIISGILPAYRSVVDKGDLNNHQQARLDKFEYGVGNQIIDGNYTQVADWLEKTINGQKQKKQILLYKLRNGANTEKFLPWTAQDSYDFIKSFLESKGLFSDAQYNPNTKKPHAYKQNPDGTQTALWIIVQQIRKAMSVLTNSCVINIPLELAEDTNAYERVPVNIHEITHLLQRVNTDKLGLALLEAVGAARRMQITEGGAMFMQNLANRLITGEENTLKTAAYEGILARLQGGDILDVALAHNAEAIRTDLARGLPILEQDGSLKKSEADKYARGAFRIFSGTEDYSAGNEVIGSHVLNYMEQEALFDQIPEEDKVLMHFTGINYRHYQILKKLGILDLNKIDVTTISEEEIRKMWEDFLAKKNLES